MRSVWKRLRDNKVTEAFVVLSLKDIPLSPPYVIIPVGEEAIRGRWSKS